MDFQLKYLKENNLNLKFSIPEYKLKLPNISNIYAQKMKKLLKNG